jgi:ParD-like antitoxin of type II bacterial toxin-antitoxin system
MGLSVNLDTALVESARTYSKVLHRSVPKQIEHWAMVGRIAEENPDLPYEIIKDILLAIEDVKEGNIEEYKGFL